MQRDELMQQLDHWAQAANLLVDQNAEAQIQLRAILWDLNAQAPPQVGDKIILRPDVGDDQPPSYPIIGIVPANRDLGLDEQGYVVLVGPNASQIYAASDFLVQR